jgi:hypothetical protein
VKDTGTELIAELGGVEVMRYAYRPDAPVVESPKPYLHPLRTLAGDVVTAYRPHDHRWHKGIQMTISHLSGENFWGGPSYVDGGYVSLPNNGIMRHREFEALDPDRFVETLSWHTQAGARWIDERRHLGLNQIDDTAWELSFATGLHNVHDETLRIGSPTTHGRPMAGYCGFFWRGPRSFTDGTVIAETDDAEMGVRSRWLAYVGQHDEVDRLSTLLFIAEPSTIWFVRATPFAAVNPSLAFHEEVPLPPGENLSVAYRVVIADGAWSRERVESYMEESA